MVTHTTVSVEILESLLEKTIRNWSNEEAEQLKAELERAESGGIKLSSRGERLKRKFVNKYSELYSKQASP